jgi:hypothetical protein
MSNKIQYINQNEKIKTEIVRVLIKATGLILKELGDVLIANAHGREETTKMR